MDPRHPELAIERMVELMTQFNLILKDMKHATVSTQLGQLEREGGLVVQEICLVAPRLHEAMMQASRQRRHDLTHGIISDEEAKEALRFLNEKRRELEEQSAEKPKKKTTRKKKTAKKKEDK